MTVTLGGFAQLGFDFEDPIEVQKGKVVVFDLETQKSFDEVGGRNGTQNLKMSVGVLYDFLSNSFRTYREKEVEAMVDDLFSAELVIGYNHVGFDYRVLSAYTHRDFDTLSSLDMMCVVERNLGFRVKLDNLVSCTIGGHKAGDGLQAIEWFRTGEWDKLEYYCKEDVRLTRELYDFGRQHKYVHYEDFNTGALGKVPGRLVSSMLNLQRDLRPLEELKARGTLVLIGGAEDKKGDKLILRKFVELCGGESARIAVLATATRKTHDAGDRYCQLFRELGVAEAATLPIYSRLDANNIKYVRYMSEVTGVFFTGGNQITLTSILGGTQFLGALQDAYVRGATVAGTSAGASAIARHMIMHGDNGLSPTKGMASIAAGLGLLQNLVVDQHFGNRRRMGRLLTVVAHNPFLLGVGIDEDTAIIVRPDNMLECLGKKSVTILDGTSITYSNVSYVEGAQTPLCIYDVRMHILLAGSTYDVLRRVPLTPPAP